MPRLTVLFFLLLLACCGCLSADDLLTEPRPGALAQQLQRQIDDLLASDYRTDAPVSGDNRQSLQMRDLDGDGLDEVLLFLRSSADPTQRSIMLFSQNDEEYLRRGSVSAIATGVQSVSYADLDGDGLQEVIVGWSSESLSVLSIYALYDGMLSELCEPIAFNNYVLGNLYSERKSITSLIVVRTDSTARYGYAEMYDMVNNKVDLTATASLSQNISLVNRMRFGPLSDGVPGVFVTARYAPPQTMDAAAVPENSEVTDILCYRDGSLMNVTLNMETGVSDLLVRPRPVAASDIDHNGVYDLARLIQLPPYPQPADAEAQPDILYEYQWYSYDSKGLASLVARTYHGAGAGTTSRSWYIVLGEQWPEAYTVRRISTATNTSVTFCYQTDEGLPVDILTITSFSRTAGDTSDIRGRIVLDETTNHVTVGEIHSLPARLAAYELTEGTLKSMFSLVKNDWR